MKAVLIILAVVVAMALLGWITFSNSGDRPAVTVQTDVIRRDTQSAAEASKRAARKAAVEASPG
jgi:type II secretory pathway pseudopilin PulG